MARIHPLYTGLFALLVAFGVFVSFKTTIFQHGGSRDLCSDMGGGNDVCGETVIVLKEFLDKVIAETYKELTKDTTNTYRHMETEEDGISFDELKLQDRNPVAKLESYEPIANTVKDSRRKKKG